MGDLRRLKDEVTIGCNGLFLAFEEMGFTPTCYTVEDRLVAEDRAREINEIRGPWKILPWDLTYCLRWTPGTAFVNFVRKYEGFPRFSSAFSSRVYWGGTVTFLNLQLARFLGCHEIVLVGIDHSYRTPPAEAHGVITSGEADINHFDPRYFGPGYRYHDPKVERMEEAYLEARRDAEACGYRILNATRGGRLEVFPRVEFDSLLGGA